VKLKAGELLLLGNKSCGSVPVTGVVPTVFRFNVTVDGRVVGDGVGVGTGVGVGFTFGVGEGVGEGVPEEGAVITKFSTTLVAGAYVECNCGCSRRHWSQRRKCDGQ
jgi:hypothetical protein